MDTPRERVRAGLVFALDRDLLSAAAVDDDAANDAVVVSLDIYAARRAGAVAGGLGRDAAVSLGRDGGFTRRRGGAEGAQGVVPDAGCRTTNGTGKFRALGSICEKGFHHFLLPLKLWPFVSIEFASARRIAIAA